MKCSGKHDTTWTIPRSITFPPPHFMLYRGKSISFGTVYHSYLYENFRDTKHYKNALLRQRFRETQNYGKANVIRETKHKF